MTRLVSGGFIFLLVFSSGCVRQSVVAVTPTVEVTVNGVVGKPLVTAESVPENDGRAVGDLVDVEWKGTWWPATLLERRGHRWFVHYDGYADEWNEVVALDRIRDRRPAEDEPVLVPMEDDVDP